MAHSPFDHNRFWFVARPRCAHRGPGLRARGGKPGGGSRSYSPHHGASEAGAGNSFARFHPGQIQRRARLPQRIDADSASAKATAGAQQITIVTLKKAEKEAFAAYRDLAKIARAVFAYNPSHLVTLGRRLRASQPRSGGGHGAIQQTTTSQNDGLKALKRMRRPVSPYAPIRKPWRRSAPRPHLENIVAVAVPRKSGRPTRPSFLSNRSQHGQTNHF